MYEEYEKNPVVTKQRMFFEAMEEVLPEMKVVIDHGNGVQKVLPLDSFIADQSSDDGSTEKNSSASGTDTQSSSSASSADGQ